MQQCGQSCYADGGENAKPYDREALPLNPSHKRRLSVMMFLQYAVPGATVPILSLYLKDHLGIAPFRAGMIMAMPSAAASVAPLIASRIADRWMGARSMLMLCHGLAALLMLWLYRVHSFSFFISLYFLYGLCFAPTFGLTNTVVLQHASDARRDFGGIRMWGTLGWVAVAWVFGYWWLKGDASGTRLGHALLVSAFASAALALFMLRLTGSSFDKPAAPLYGEVFCLFLRPEMLLLCLLNFLNGACHQFYYFGMSPFLVHLRFPEAYIMPGMSIGQASEVLVLLFLGWFLSRISMKRIMLWGVIAQGLRMLIFAFTENHIAIVAGIALHGFCYAFFFTTAYLYVEKHSTSATRAGAQQLLTLMISGAGPLAGFLFAGWTAQFFSDPVSGIVDYRMFWLIPGILCAIIALWLHLGFRERAVVDRAAL